MVMLHGGDYEYRVSRINFANDTATASPRGPLNSSRSRAWWNW